MSAVHISSQNRSRAQKSLTRLYKARFGQDSLSTNQKMYTRSELVQRYADNLLFWKGQTPEILPGVNEFTIAKHAICSNAMEQLKQQAKKYKIEEDVLRLVGE
jgi:hypothetical protein